MSEFCRDFSLVKLYFMVWCWTSEADEVAEILANFGLEPNEYWPVVEALRKRPEAWIDFMMR